MFEEIFYLNGHMINFLQNQKYVLDFYENKINHADVSHDFYIKSEEIASAL